MTPGSLLLTPYPSLSPQSVLSSPMMTEMPKPTNQIPGVDLAALRTLGRKPNGNNPQTIEPLHEIDESNHKSSPLPSNQPPDSRGVSVKGYEPNQHLQEPKFKDQTIHADDDPTQRILAYYNPKTLGPEYASPQLVKLSWTTKIPLVNGVPFWERLPEEPTDYYELFSHYRDQDLFSPQIINNQFGGPYVGIRILTRTAEHFNIDPNQLEEIAEVWMWTQRVDTYEEFGNLLIEQQRSKKIVVMESKHIEIAEKMRDKAMEAFEAMDIDRLTPNQMREWIKFATELERLSIGLPEHEPIEGNPSDNKRNNNGGPPGIALTGDNQKVQIVFDKDWQSS